MQRMYVSMCMSRDDKIYGSKSIHDLGFYKLAWSNAKKEAKTIVTAMKMTKLINT